MERFAETPGLSSHKVSIDLPLKKSNPIIGRKQSVSKKKSNLGNTVKVYSQKDKFKKNVSLLGFQSETPTNFIVNSENYQNNSLNMSHYFSDNNQHSMSQQKSPVGLGARKRSTQPKKKAESFYHSNIISKEKNKTRTSKRT
jgi:hypothetical protein